MPPKIVSFSPGIAKKDTAFEAMADTYKWLQQKGRYDFTVIADENDDFDDSLLKITRIKSAWWKPFARLPLFAPKPGRNALLARLMGDADGILTCDPIVRFQGLLALRFAEQTGKPAWFNTSITNVNQGRDMRWRYIRPVVRPHLKRVAGIIATVPKCIERFADINLADADILDRIVLSGHPVDVERFTPRSPGTTERIRILALTRLVPEKGVTYTLDAMIPLLRKYPQVEFTLAGSGPLAGFLKQKAASSDVADQIKIIPAMPRSKVAEFLRSFDIYISNALSNSHWEEFFGALNIEAMASGLACIITPSGGCRSVIDDDTAAIFVPERDVSAQRSAIERVIKDSTLRESLARNGRIYATRRYALPVVGEELAAILGRGLTQARPN